MSEIGDWLKRNKPATCEHPDSIILVPSATKWCVNCGALQIAPGRAWKKPSGVNALSFTSPDILLAMGTFGKLQELLLKGPKKTPKLRVLPGGKTKKKPKGGDGKT